MAQYTGKVVGLNSAKGFGFLSHDGGPDIFVHYTGIQRYGPHSLKEVDAVWFGIFEGPRGPQADQVFRIKQREGSHDASSSLHPPS